MNLFKIREGQIQKIPERSYRDQQVGAKGEVTLESFLVDHPEVIPGEEIDADTPPVFVVIQSQAGVTPGSMDILLLDQMGVPTIIEAKLADNREIRRSVMAQGLEYLAHLQLEWPAERFQEAAIKFRNGNEQAFEEEVEQRFGQPLNNDYWDLVQANLQSGRMRLIIAADNIPSELKTLIEFLNEMAQFDVLGLEIRLFATKHEEDQILLMYWG